MSLPHPLLGDQFRKVGSYFEGLEPNPQVNPDMTIRVQEGGYWKNGSEYIQFPNTTSPIMAAPTVDAKWTAVCIDDQNHLIIVDSNVAAIPDQPVIPQGCLPIAFVYLTPTVNVISRDDIFDVRPLFTNGSTPAPHNLIPGRDLPNQHPISSIIGLQSELDSKATEAYVDSGLAGKADCDGTPCTSFTLNDEIGNINPSVDASLRVARGNMPDVEIRWNELMDVWQATSDGVTYFNIGQSVQGLEGMLTDVQFVDSTDVNFIRNGQADLITSFSPLIEDINNRVFGSSVADTSAYGHIPMTLPQSVAHQSAITITDTTNAAFGNFDVVLVNTDTQPISITNSTSYIINVAHVNHIINSSRTVLIHPGVTTTVKFANSDVFRLSSDRRPSTRLSNGGAQNITEFMVGTDVFLDSHVNPYELDLYELAEHYTGSRVTVTNLSGNGATISPESGVSYTGDSDFPDGARLELIYSPDDNGDAHWYGIISGETSDGQGSGGSGGSGLPIVNVPGDAGSITIDDQGKYLIGDGTVDIELDDATDGDEIVILLGFSFVEIVSVGPTIHFNNSEDVSNIDLYPRAAIQGYYYDGHWRLHNLFDGEAV